MPHQAYALGLTLALTCVNSAEGGRSIALDVFWIDTFTSAVSFQSRDGHDVHLAGVQAQGGAAADLERLNESLGGTRVSCYVADSRVVPQLHWCSFEDGTALNTLLIEMGAATALEP